MAELALSDVTRTYGDVVALEDVSVDVEAGRFHCLLGPNGSGKTTALRLLVGLARPTTGTVTRGDVDVGYGFQRPSFYPSLTVGENLAVFAGMLDAPDDGWRDRLLDELRLRPAVDRRAGDLSGGFARKLDLALALLGRPEVVLLDEPLGALDDVSKRRLLSFLAEYRDAGNAVVVSTHRATDFEPHLDRVTIVFDGEVLEDATLDGLDRPAGESLQDYYVRRVLARDGADAEST